MLRDWLSLGRARSPSTPSVMTPAKPSMLLATTGRATPFGGVFDSVIDRLFEGAVLGGVLYYYLDSGDKTASMLTFVTVVGSLCVSYVRARAEGEGIKIYDGIFTRVVRLLVLTFGLVTALLTPVLWVLALMTVATTFHRLFALWLKFREQESTP